VRHDRHEIAGADMPDNRRLILAINATVNRMDEPIAFARDANLEKCAAEDPFAVAVNVTPTGLSIPPVNTGSSPVPSGRERKMCAARETKSLPFGNACCCSAAAPFVQ